MLWINFDAWLSLILIFAALGNMFAAGISVLDIESTFTRQISWTSHPIDIVLLHSSMFGLILRSLEMITCFGFYAFASDSDNF